MGIKLYTMDLSPPVRAAMMAFEIFDVLYEKIELNLVANENKTPEYLKKNPLHSILLEDGDFILHDMFVNLLIKYPLIVEGNKNVEQKRYDDIAEAYGFLEEFLSRTKFLAADNITIADVAALSSVTGLEVLLPIDAKKFPKTTAWLANLKQTSFSKKQNESGATQLDQLIKKCFEA